MSTLYSLLSTSVEIPAAAWGKSKRILISAEPRRQLMM